MTIEKKYSLLEQVCDKEIKNTKIYIIAINKKIT